MTDEHDNCQEFAPEHPEVGDRRSDDRHQYSGVDQRLGLDRRRGPGRRRNDDRRAAEEGEMNDEQFAFIMAVEEYRRVNKRPFPSLTELLEIAKALGYRKVADPQPLVGAETSETV